MHARYVDVAHRERLYRAAALRPVSFTPVPAVEAGSEILHLHEPTAGTGRLVLNKPRV